MAEKHLGDVAHDKAVVDISPVQPAESPTRDRSDLSHNMDIDNEEVKPSVRRRIKQIIWDTLDYSPTERRFVSKIDFFIL
jgi:MFS transporter, ACS family, pantothenate transporter